MQSETQRILRILEQGNAPALFDNADAIADHIRALAAENTTIKALRDADPELSRAAALLRAVEGLSEIGKLRTAKLAGKWQATVFDRELGIDHVSERFDAPVDALIALWAWRKEARDAG